MTIRTEPTTAEKISKLPWSIGANSANTVFAQFTFFGSVFVLFLSALGLNKSQIGGLLSLVPYTGLVALFIAPWVARFGYKKTYLTFFGARKIVTVFLLFTPWVASFGAQTLFIYVSVIVFAFALCRSIAETGVYPWMQEYVPNSVRGKYSATNNVFASLIGFFSVGVASFVIGRASGLNGYMLLIGIGVLAGLISVWAATHIPGGDPVREAQKAGMTWRDLLGTFRDRDFLFYMVGVSLFTLAVNPVNAFLPLFMQEEAGISSGNVILIQAGALLGGLLSTYLWGWAADRYGSRPVTLSGICLRTLLPLFLMAMPRNSPIGLYLALGIVLIQGIADMGWAIGASRLLFVSIVPAEEKTTYMAMYYAWIGVVGGTSQLLGGQIVQASSGLSGQFFIFNFDPYTGLFILGLALPVLSLLLLRGVRSDTRVTVEQFAGMFLRGNPFLAITSLVGYQFARDERDVVEIAERLGETRSPLTVDELLELLKDPRFNVRFETIISIARTRPDPRLTEALLQVLNGTELALSTIAAWALGRIGDWQAREALSQGLDAPYHSIRAHSARALGALGDTGAIPLLMERLERETDKGLQMAYASALGKLQAREATRALLDLLDTFENEGARLELALSLARLVGNEGHFIRMVREAPDDPGTITAQAASALKKKIRRDRLSESLEPAIEASASALARGELQTGAHLLSELIDQVPAEKFEPTSLAILQECGEKLKTVEAARQLDYILLALHTMEIAWQS